MSATRGISFERAAAFEWDKALIVEDARRDYGERRFQALGVIDSRLHVLVFTPRAGKTPRHQPSQSEPARGETI